MAVLNQSAIGYSHLANKKDCQDFSMSYSNGERSMIMVSDGHGGKVYIRSDRGSKFACIAAFVTFMKIDKSKICIDMPVEYKNKLRLELLCEWNHLIEQDYGENPFTKEELKELNDDQKDKIRDNPAIAYGCTLHAGVIVNNLLLSFTIGDGGLFAVNDNKMIEISSEDDDNVANITNSLCDDKAYNDIHVAVTDISEFNTVMCVTDGVVNPYQSFENFRESFAVPTSHKLTELNGNYQIKYFIIELGREKGIGDDCSIAAYYK